MIKISGDTAGKRQLCTLVLSGLLMLGVFCGALFLSLFREPIESVSGSVLFSGVFAGETGSMWISVSAFLFDSLFYLCIVFLFGMTFMGVAIIPVTVFFKGVVLGMSLSALLSLYGLTAFFRSWITYLPAASFCLCVFLIFCGRAFDASRHAFGLLLGHAASFSWRPYCKMFFPALLLTLGAALVHGALYALLSIFF